MSNLTGSDGGEPRQTNPRPSENHLVATPDFDPSLAYSHLTLPSGEWISIPTNLLLSFQTQPAESSPANRQGVTSTFAQTAGGPADGVLDPEALIEPPLVLALAEEQLTIGKRLVERETVRLQRTVETHVETAEVELEDISWEVHRVPVDTVVTSAPKVRTEGETTIYPVLTERAVLTRQLVLAEEVHVTRRTSTRREIVESTLRRGKLNVEHVPAR